MKRKLTLFITMIYILSTFCGQWVQAANIQDNQAKNTLMHNQEVKPQYGQMPTVQYAKEEPKGWLDHAAHFFSDIFSNKEDKNKTEEKKNIQRAVSSTTAQNTIFPESLLAEIHYGEVGIHPLTRNYSKTETDFTISAPGHTLSFTRTYNSNDVEWKYKLMGDGWTFSFQCVLNDNQVVGDTRYISVSMPNGSWQLFKMPVSQKCESVGNTSALQIVDGKYQLTTKDKYKYIFNPSNDTGIYYLTKIIDPNGNAVTINRRAGNIKFIESIVDSANRTYTFAYYKDKISSITLPGNRIIYYGYDTNGNYLTSVSGDTNAKRIYEYKYNSIPGVNNFIIIKDENLNVLEEQFTTADYLNVFGNSYHISQGYGRWNIEDSNKRVVTKNYDQNGYLFESSDEAARFTTITYNSTYPGLIQTVKDVHGANTGFEYDIAGNIIQRINHDSTIAENTYDTNNNLVYEEDESGNITQYIYDSNGINLIKKIKPLDGTTEYSETADINLFAVTEYAYYTDSEMTTFGCAAKGMIKAEKNPEGRTIVYGYDAWGNTTRVRELNETPSDINSASLNSPGKELTRVYNALGQMTKSTSPKGVVTEYFYDNRGNLIRQTVNGTDSTAYYYDYAGRVIKEVSPNQYTGSENDPGTTYTYYPSGKTKTKTDIAGKTTTYTYDLYGNLTKEVYPDGSGYEYVYDIVNRLANKIFFDKNGAERRSVEQYFYDKPVTTEERGEQSQALYKNEIFTFDGVSQNVLPTKQLMDARKRIVREIAPDGGITDIEYYGNSTVKRKKNPNGLQNFYKYNGYNKVEEQWEQSFDTAYQYKKFEYDKVGQLLKEHTSKTFVNCNNGADIFTSPRPTVDTFITTQNTYNKNGTLSSTQVIGGKKSEFRYDNDGNMTARDDFTSDTDKITTIYTYNYQKKPLTKTQTLQNSDMTSGGTGATFLITSYSYDKNGNLVTTALPNGATSTNTYDQQNRIARTVTAGQTENGSATNITNWSTYTWDGKPLSTSDANGNVTTNTYDGRGNVIREERSNNGEKNIVAREYDLKGNVIREVAPADYDPNQSELSQMKHTQYIYDAAGRVLVKKYVTPGSELVLVAYSYDKMGNLIKELNAEQYAKAAGSSYAQKMESGAGTTYTYNGAKQVLCKTDAASKSTYFTYDGMGRKIKEKNAENIETGYEYDANGNVRQTMHGKAGDPPIILGTATYDKLGNPLTVTDANSHSKTYTYTSLAQMKSETLPGDETIPVQTTNYYYDLAGNVSKKENGVAISTYAYDKQNRLLSESTTDMNGADSITKGKRYDKQGNLRFEIDGNGNTTEHVYDGLNRKIENRISVNGVVQSEKTVYDKNGNAIKNIDKFGYTTTNCYDDFDRIVAQIDPYGKMVKKYEYDRNGNQTKLHILQENGTYTTTSYEYDVLGRLIKTTYPEGNSVQKSYDNIGRVHTEKDGRDNVTTYAYDSQNRIENIENAKKENTRFTYDPVGNQLSKTDGRQNTTYKTYNARNLITRDVDAGGKNGDNFVDGRFESYKYRMDGTLSSKRNRNGKSIIYNFDAHGRMKSMSRVSWGISYDYDGNNNPTTISTIGNSISRTYDELNRVKTKTETGFGTMCYTDDIPGEDGNYLEKMRDPQGNETVREYDKLGRLIRVDETRYSYDTAGRKIRTEYPNDTYTIYAYDQNNRVTTVNSYTDGNTAPKDQFSYTYDACGNVLTANEKINGVSYEPKSFDYDVLNRVSIQQKPSPTPGITDTEEYIYDAAGNRIYTNFIDGVTGIGYSWTSRYNERNQMTSNDQFMASYTYDNNGNMKSKTMCGTTTDYAYDDFDRMTDVSTGSATVSYSYNGENQRIGRTEGTKKEQYLYNGDNIIREKNETGRIIRNTYGQGLVSRAVDTTTSMAVGNSHSVDITYGDMRYYRDNGHGDVSAVTNGITTDANTYDAFGSKITTQLENPYGYQGARYDATSGLYRMGEQDYDVDTARFLTMNTKQDNPYVYSNNNPLSYADYSSFAPLEHKAPDEPADEPKFELGEIVANDGVTALDGYVRKNLDPVMVNNGYSQKIQIDRAIEKASEEEKRRERAEYEAIMAEVDQEKAVSYVSIMLKGAYKLTQEILKKKIGGTRRYYLSSKNYEISFDKKTSSLSSGREIDPNEFISGGIELTDEKYEDRYAILTMLRMLSHDSMQIVEKTDVYSNVHYFVKITAQVNGNRPVGADLIRQLVTNKNGVKIRYRTSSEEDSESHGSATYMSATNASKSGVGSNMIVKISRSNATYLVKYEDSDKSFEKSHLPYITLGHELIHALRGMKGNRKPKDIEADYWYVADDGKNYKYRAQEEELDTVGVNYIADNGDQRNAWKWRITENSLRDEQNLPRRVSPYI